MQWFGNRNSLFSIRCNSGILNFCTQFDPDNYIRVDIKLICMNAISTHDSSSDVVPISAQKKYFIHSSQTKHATDLLCKSYGATDPTMHVVNSMMNRLLKIALISDDTNKTFINRSFYLCYSAARCCWVLSSFQWWTLCGCNPGWSLSCTLFWSYSKSTV